MSVAKIIVEGANLSGKTSIVRELEDEFVHSLVITLHGYYHPKFLEVAKGSEQALEYHRKRLQAFLPIFSQVHAEELIFNRFHLTASVYLKLFYNLEEHFYNIEEELNKLDVCLVLADFNDQALKKRLEERLLLSKETPWGDSDFSKTKEKRDLYRYFFEKSRMRKKFLIDNSDITAEEAVKIIKEKQNLDL
jgi:hypothetical protein